MPNYTYVYDKMTEIKIHHPQIPSVTEVIRLITPEILSPDIVGRAETEEGSQKVMGGGGQEGTRRGWWKIQRYSLFSIDSLPLQPSLNK